MEDMIIYKVMDQFRHLINIYRMHLLVQKSSKVLFDLEEAVSDFLQYYNSKNILQQNILI